MIEISTGRDSMGYPVYSKRFKELAKKFYSVVNGGNAITPVIFGYWEEGDILAEVSHTNERHYYVTGMKMYGVTVIKDGVKNNELSKACFSIAEVEQYLKTISKL